MVARREIAITDPKERDEAVGRTELAEDRTLMAVERTLASWLSASFAAIGVGLGFRALFHRLEPPWLPRLVASLFLLLAAGMALAAERRACRALDRLSSHEIVPLSDRWIRFSAYGVAAGALTLLVGLWFFYD